MQRALSFETTPAASVPLRFMLAAPCFAVAAGLLLAWTGGAALQSRWFPSTLALTHLMTLGFLGMAMLGSMLQMLPVVAEAAVPQARAVALLAWGGLACGAPLLAAALMTGLAPLFVAAALLLGLALLVFIGAVMVALLRRASAGAMPMVAGMRLAVPGFAAAAVLGLSLAVYFAGGAVIPAAQVTDLHAALGLVGWVAMLVVAVSFQVIPMFQATPVYPRWLSRTLPVALAVLLCGWGAARWLGLPWQRWAGAGIAALLAAFSCYSLHLLSKTRRKEPDITTWYWFVSLASLAACSIMYVAPGIDEDKRAMLLGILFIAGFAMSAVNGMLYKIVPFLLWYHLSARGIRREAVPKVNAWIAPRTSKRQFWIHAAALATLCLSVEVPGLARAAGLLFAADAGLIGFLLAAAALRYRRTCAASALESA
jgi:hypothetical protein